MSVEAGTFVKTGSPHIIEVLGTTGMNFAVVDAEHAPYDRGMLDLMVLAGRAAALPVWIRVPDDRHSTLLSALDMGAAGLLIPHVDSAAQAAEIVRHCRFAGGERGYSGSPRFAGYGSLGKDETLKRGDEARIMVQIESAASVRECEAIAATRGVDGVFIGRGDLSLSMGEVSPSAPVVLAATRRIIQAGVAAGKTVGMFVGSAAEADEFAPLGVNWFIFGSDQTILRKGALDIAAYAARPDHRKEAAA